ncbi:IclR family transcriptional regulator C-terminal domain-containing protein [Actinotalea sp.]|uniref:IclR family transcriptional regulator domain-containing protein n=1 Tax=Actinotalea sp. TaxID=1872145 RepID=UPI00356A7C2C
MRVWSAVGRRIPAVTTALGRALLAYRGTTRTALSAYVGAAVAPAGPTDASRPPVDAEQVWSVIERARVIGYATEDEENEPGISCLAVPLLRSGTAVAAVSITAPAERMSAARVARLHAQLREVLPPLLPGGLTLPAL